MPPAARPRKLPATLRSAYVRLSQSRCARLALLESHASLALPQAAGLVHFAACPLQIATAGAGLQFGTILPARKSRQKDALRMRGGYRLSMPEAPESSAAASTRKSLFRIALRAACIVANLPMIVVATQGHRRIDCHTNQNAPTYSPGNFRRKRRCVSIYTGLDSVVCPLFYLIGPKCKLASAFAFWKG